MSSQHKTSASVSPVTLLVAIGMALLFFYRVLVLFEAHAGHDQSWYLYAAQQILSGVTLYGPHLSETNPPLVIWFSLVPVWFAHLIHGSPTFGLRLVVLTMIFLSTTWSIRLLRLCIPSPKSAPLLLTAWAIAFVEFDIPSYDFGQREQLLVILVIPYILAVTSGAVRRLSSIERCALGVAAGLAICIKPQHLLIIAGIELFLAIYLRSVRRLIAPELLSVLLTGGVYLLLVRLITPLYMKETVPLLFDTYWAYGTLPALAVAHTQGKTILLALLEFVACFALRKYVHNLAIPIGLAVCGLASSIAFDIQHTGWYYQSFPSREFVLLAALYLLIDISNPIINKLTDTPHLSMRIAIATFGLTVVPLSILTVHFHKPAPIAHSELDDFLAQCKPHTSVYVFSTSLFEFSSVFNSNLNWSSRFPALWMLPAIIQNEQGATGPPAPFKKLPALTLARLANLQRTETVEDLNYWKPSVVLVEHCTVDDPCQSLEDKNFDMAAWFLQSPAFADAWSHYQRQQSLPSFDLYTRIR